MNKELADRLRHMQTHPTTGTPHNQQVISAQVETIFAIDELKGQIERLNNTLKVSEQQSQKLALSNYRLQIAMFVLTFIATAVTVSLAVGPIFAIVAPYINVYLTSGIAYSISVTVLTLIISGILALIIFKFEKHFADKIYISDSIKLVLKDKDGKIKDIRNN